MKQFLILVATLFFVKICFAASPINLDSIGDNYLIKGSNYDYFQDSTAQLSFNEILKSQGNVFSNHHPETQIIHEVNSNHWVRFNLKSEDYAQKRIIEVITPQTEHVTFFTPKQTGGYDEIASGYLLPYEQRSYDHKNFIFDIPLDADFSKPFFIKVKSTNKVGLLFKIRTQQFFTAYSLNEYFDLGAYYGVLGLLIIYNLIIFIYLRRKVYLAYSLVVLCAIGLSMSDDGLGFALVWPNHPGWSQTLGLDIFPVSFLLAYTFYSYQFLTKKYHEVQKIILYTTIAYLVYFLFEILFTSEKFYFSYAYSIPFIVIYIGYWYVVLKFNYKPGRFFVLGNTFALSGVIIEQLRLLEVVEGNVFTVYAFEAGILIEYLAFSLSLAYQYSSENKQLLMVQKQKVNLLKKNQEASEEKIQLLNEKEQLSQKVNRELEEKVRERTEEVQEANDKLRSLVENLEKMSITLDKENWQLKRVIKEEKKQRLLGDEISIEEVYSLYPSKASCLKFLEQLKWDENFECSKCGNTKYSSNNKDFSRKCSKCGKIDSVTSNSIFHAQKLPLQVMFYLIHLVFSHTTYDISVLSKELEISENSLYRFIAKVKTRMKEPKSNTWEDLIY